MSEQDMYHRYHIETQEAPNIAPHPTKFRAKVSKIGLATYALGEILHYRNLKVALSRPCIYEVYSRPVGGMAPIHENCVACLRCTVEHPEVAQIHPNPKRQQLGDSYISPDNVETILYEATTGRVPVHGAGYRGRFGGPGWDGMWTDMSEIVRPTRDGIHGREFISTVVDIGEKPAFLEFDEAGHPTGPTPRTFSISLPFIFDAPPKTAPAAALLPLMVEAARDIDALAIVPLRQALRLKLEGPHIIPWIKAEDWEHLDTLTWQPRLLLLQDWDPARFQELRRRFPDSLVAVRLSMGTNLLPLIEQGASIFHLTANYHGYVGDQFALELIQDTHTSLVQAGCREEVTLIGSGGIAMAEHVPKAIIAGLDAVALDTAPLVALQGSFESECVDWETAQVRFPRLDAAWGVQRLKNLAASWHDQLLEILGAMGLREVRRLRGELGRVMFQKDLERAAFGGIEGYDG